MTYIVISVLMIIVGFIGILKSKVPKVRESSGFAAEMVFYFSFYLLVIYGIIFFILLISGDSLP